MPLPIQRQRAFWILDDLGAIQQSKGDFANKTVKVYQPKPTYLMRGAGGGPPSLHVGQDPAEGVVIDYYLKEKADTNKVTLEIMDQTGKSIRKYSSKKDESFKSFPGGPPAPVVIRSQKRASAIQVGRTPARSTSGAVLWPINFSARA